MDGPYVAEKLGIHVFDLKTLKFVLEFLLVPLQSLDILPEKLFVSILVPANRMDKCCTRLSFVLSEYLQMDAKQGLKDIDQKRFSSIVSLFQFCYGAFKGLIFVLRQD